MVSNFNFVLDLMILQLILLLMRLLSVLTLCGVEHPESAKAMVQIKAF